MCVCVGPMGAVKGKSPSVSQGRGGASDEQDGAVNLQHGTREDENLHP